MLTGRVTASVLALLAAVFLLPGAGAVLIGSTDYPPATYDVEGWAYSCQANRVSMGGEVVVEVVLVDFIGTVNDDPVDHALMHWTVPDGPRDVCNVKGQGGVLLDFDGAAEATGWL